MAGLMRAKEWSTTSLGAIDTWPQSLRTIVRVLLTSRFAMWMGWGPELTFFYNDAYARHDARRQASLGARPAVARGLGGNLAARSGRASSACCRPAKRRGTRTCCCSSSGAGIQRRPTTRSPTARVHRRSGRRRRHALRGHRGDRACDRRAADGAAARHSRRAASRRPTRSRAVSRAVRATLDADLRDLPFTLTYLFDEAGDARTLVCRTGIAPDDPAAVRDDRASRRLMAAWPRARGPDAIRAGVVVDLAGRFRRSADGRMGQASDARARLADRASRRRSGPPGIFVAALNPFRPLDDSYRELRRAARRASSRRDSPTRTPTRRNAAASKRSRRSIARRRRSFSNVSHEFRTPLTLMLGPVEDASPITSSRCAVATANALELVHRNALRLLKLVNTLLDFSRIEAGRVARAIRACRSVRRSRRNWPARFGRPWSGPGSTFDGRCEPIAEPVYVDRDMWEKIVLNLLSNAFKFTLARQRRRLGRPRGDGRARPCGRGHGHRHSAGRAAARLRAVSSRRGLHGRSHEGSGIGLALVHELVKLHGGELGVESEVGSGHHVHGLDSRSARRICLPNRLPCAASAPVPRRRPTPTPKKRCDGCRADRRRRSETATLSRDAGLPPRRPSTSGTCCSPTTTRTCATTRDGCCRSDGPWTPSATAAKRSPPRAHAGRTSSSPT